MQNVDITTLEFHIIEVFYLRQMTISKKMKINLAKEDIKINRFTYNIVKDTKSFLGLQNF